MPNQSVKITKTVVEKAPLPESGQTFLRDTDLKGFAVRLTPTGVRTFVVEKRIDGRVRRITLGRHTELTVAMARTRAHQILGQVAMGIDPIGERRRRIHQATTLRACFEDFKKARKHLSPATLYDYDRILRLPLKDWRKKPISAIRPDMVHQRFRKIAEERGESYANLTMRCLRSLLNFAIANYDDGTGEPILRSNPVNVLTRTKAWYRTARRQTVIKVHQLEPWHAAVESLRHHNDIEHTGNTVADLVNLILFTGLRRQEANQLTWSAVDLEERTLHIAKTKNGEPAILPMSTHVHDLLVGRQQHAMGLYVFPGRRPTWYLIEPKKHIAAVIEHSGVPFIIHDLRRTFITVAEALDVSPYAIKRLVNHKMHNDVTAGYIVSDVERLRRPTQRICDFFLRAFDGEARNVVPFPISQLTTTQSNTRLGDTTQDTPGTR